MKMLPSFSCRGEVEFFLRLTPSTGWLAGFLDNLDPVKLSSRPRALCDLSKQKSLGNPLAPHLANYCDKNRFNFGLIDESLLLIRNYFIAIAFSKSRFLLKSSTDNFRQFSAKSRFQHFSFRNFVQALVAAFLKPHKPFYARQGQLIKRTQHSRAALGQ
jgi:hypothetical protein